MKEVNLLLKEKNGIACIVVEAKDPRIIILDTCGLKANNALKNDMGGNNYETRTGCWSK